MFRILQVIGGNVVIPPATVRLPEAVPTPDRFRGLVTMDGSRCLACGVCAYVCVSNAITGAEVAGGYAWAYEPGQCAFCARCVDYCPGRALAMEGSAAPAYARPGELRREVRVAFPACPDCGNPRRPATDELLGRAFGQVSAEVRELALRCERCRRRMLQRSLARGAGLGGGRDGEGRP